MYTKDERYILSALFLLFLSQDLMVTVFFYFLFDVFSFFSPKNIVDLFLLFSIFWKYLFFGFYCLL
jgi:hypothetical protein